MKRLSLRSYLLSILISLSCLHHAGHGLSLDDLISYTKKGDSIALSDLAMFIELIPMPDSMKSFLYKIVLANPTLTNEEAPKSFNTTNARYDTIITISAKPVIEGIALQVKLHVMKLVSGEKKLSILVGLPDGFQFVNIDSKLGVLNKLPLKRAAFAYSQTPYIETEWGLDMGAGANFLAVVEATGEVGGLLKQVGKNMNQVTVTGVITIPIIGSKFVVALGDGILLGQSGNIGKTTGLLLALNIIESAPLVPGLSISVQTGLSINVPAQTNPISLYGEFKYTPPALLSLSGWMPKGSFYGPPAFGIPGFAIGEFGLSAGMDLAEVAASAGFIPISQFGLAGAIKFGRSYISLKANVNYSTSPDLLMAGEAENLYLQDVVSFAADMVERAGKLVGQKADLVNKVNQKLPNIGFKLLRVYVVPKDTVFLGVSYQKGVDVALNGEIVKTAFELMLQVDETGFNGNAFVRNLKIGPLKVVSGPKAVPGTPPDQATLVLAMDAQKLLARLYIDGGIEIDVMDGIKGGATIDISKEGLYAEMTSKIFNNFEALLRITGKGSAATESNALATRLDTTGVGGGPTSVGLENDSSYGIYAKLTTNALEKLGNLLQGAAKDFMENKKKVDEFHKSSSADIQGLKQQKAELQKKIEQAKAQMQKLEAENIANITKAQEALKPLQKAKDDLEAAIAKCKGKVPEQRKNMDTLVQGKPLSAKEIDEKMAQVKKEHPEYTVDMRDMVRATLTFGAAPESVKNGMATYPGGGAPKAIPGAEGKK